MTDTLLHIPPMHPDTAALAVSFSTAVAKKLSEAEQKHGFKNDWLVDDWQEKCRRDFLRHIRKGDPLDVAGYCAFMFARGWRSGFATGKRRRVIIESPYAGTSRNRFVALLQRLLNRAYARACVRDAIARGEAPIASHLLFPQHGIQRGIWSVEDPAERQAGIEAGVAWCDVADAAVVYVDRGISTGMRYGMQCAAAATLPIEERSLGCSGWLRWSEWRGSLDGRPTLWIRHLVRLRGWRVDLHKMVAADDVDCFHTHPAHALRVILWGGYVEEIEPVRLRIEAADLVVKLPAERRSWRPGMIGIVRPRLSHRIAALRNGRASYSLWIRFRKVAAIELRGAGWARQK